jgi:hypothetical protein
MDGPAFVAYIRDVLIPEIEPGTAVVLDNLATHPNFAPADTDGTGLVGLHIVAK